MHKRIRIARGTNTQISQNTEKVPTGVPFYDITNQRLYIGKGDGENDPQIKNYLPSDSIVAYIAEYADSDISKGTIEKRLVKQISCDNLNKLYQLLESIQDKNKIINIHFTFDSNLRVNTHSYSLISSTQATVATDSFYNLKDFIASYNGVDISTNGNSYKFSYFNTNINIGVNNGISNLGKYLQLNRTNVSVDTNSSFAAQLGFSISYANTYYSDTTSTTVVERLGDMDKAGTFIITYFE